MNREDIIRMAQEAGFGGGGFVMPTHAGHITHELERFAALVASHALVEPCCGNYDQCQKVCMPRAASAEREACAKLVDYWESRQGEHSDAIRARGEASIRGDKHD